ncbi:unnamed protein product [Mytilus coruscus]|nr:unnamed protein product [Mytilus coruscus]
MVLSDSVGNLGIQYTNGTFDLIKKYPDCCKDVTFIDDSTIAASLDKTILTIKIDSKVTERAFRTRGDCQRICYYNGKLLCNVSSKGIQEIKLSNATITDLVIDEDLSSWSYIAVHKEKINLPNNLYVRYNTMEGEMLWKFSSGTMHRPPRGITVDNSGNVFVVLYKANCILLLSSDGQRSRDLQINDMSNPWSSRLIPWRIP